MSARPVVLVHGAWHGAWCWEPVAAGLGATGTKVVAIDLAGHGADTGPMADLHGDAERVRSVLDGFDEPVVLVGHSYGGVVITEAGEHPAVAHLVYIASFNLDHDESAVGVATAQTQAAGIDHSGRPDLLSAMRMADDGSCRIDPDAARLLFYDDCPADVADWAVARLGPHRLDTLSQSPSAVAWRGRPSTYAVCGIDNVVHPDLQRILACRADNVVEWPTGHSPFLSRPELVVDLVAGLARRPGG
ncbi:MAG: alpha/beta fold hydrolase [Acidimicrobiales bacterium]